MERVLGHISLLPEKVRQHRIPVPCARILMGVPQPRESQAQNCKSCFSLLVLQREREDGLILQHPTPAWSICRGMRRRRSVPEDEISLSQLEKLSLLSQGIHRLVGQGTGTEVPVNMNG